MSTGILLLDVVKAAHAISRGGGLSVILASVGFDEAQRGFAVLPALWAAFCQGRVAWGLLMVSSGAVHSELPSGLAVAKMVISCDGA